MTGDDLRRIVEKGVADLRERRKREFYDEVARQMPPEAERVLTHDIVTCKNPVCGAKNRVPVLMPDGKRPICGRCKGSI